MIFKNETSVDWDALAELLPKSTKHRADFGQLDWKTFSESTAIEKIAFKDGCCYIVYTSNPDREYRFGCEENTFNALLRAKSIGNAVGVARKNGDLKPIDSESSPS